MIQAGDLSYIVFDGRIQNHESRRLVASVFAMWHTEWSATMRDLAGLERLYSDDFTRPTLVGALLSDNIPVGSISLIRLDLSEPLGRLDSSLKSWPADTLERCAERYQGWPVWVCTYLTVATAYRGRNSGAFSFKELFGALLVEHLRDSDCRATLATVRINRGIDRTCYELGARLVQGGQILHGLEVALVEFDKENLQVRPGHPCELVAGRLYRDRVDLREREPANVWGHSQSRVAG